MKEIMRKIRKRLAAPVYGAAAVWLLYCLIFPLYRTWHFIALVCVGVLGYIILSKIFPGTTEFIEIPEEPVRTGNAEIDELFDKGGKAVEEIHALSLNISDARVAAKLRDLAAVTERIFKRLHSNPDDFKQIRRFSDLHLPTVMKILRTYESLKGSDIRGENITNTLERIDSALVSILESFKKFYDSLYYHQALDIEVDIDVLETMLKKEGFSND